MKTILGIVAIALSIGLIAYWYADGGHVYNVDQVQVEKVDELFGTVTKEWKDEPHIGLLPVVGPIAAALLVGGATLLFLGQRSKRRLASAQGAPGI